MLAYLPRRSQHNTFPALYTFTLHVCSDCPWSTRINNCYMPVLLAINPLPSLLASWHPSINHCRNGSASTTNHTFFLSNNESHWQTVGYLRPPVLLTLNCVYNLGLSVNLTPSKWPSWLTNWELSDCPVFQLYFPANMAFLCGTSAPRWVHALWLTFG